MLQFAGILNMVKSFLCGFGTSLFFLWLDQRWLRYLFFLKKKMYDPEFFQIIGVFIMMSYCLLTHLAHKLNLRLHSHIFKLWAQKLKELVYLSSLSKFLGSLQSIMKEINSCNQKLQNFWAAKPKPISNLYIKLGVF